MALREIKSGDQVRKKCTGGPSGQFLGRYGYVVDLLDDNMYSVLWTHDSLGYPQISPTASHEHLFDLWATGEVYSTFNP